jgi:hypothetical protein
MGKKNFSNKSKKGILLGFESSNNFIVYIPEDNKVIISRDIIIKEELNYKDDYKLDKDYNTLLELDLLDYNNYILIYNKKPILEDISSPKNTKDNLYNISNNELSISIILKRNKIRNTSNRLIIN